MKKRPLLPIVVIIAAIWGIVGIGNQSKKTSNYSAYTSRNMSAAVVSVSVSPSVSPVQAPGRTVSPTKSSTAIPTSIPKQSKPYGTSVVASTPFMTASPSRSPAPTRSPTRVPPYTIAPKSTAASTPIPGTNYVLNRNTKKFHKPSCSEVKRIKDSNRVDYFGIYSEVINMGYVPCKKCNPK